MFQLSGSVGLGPWFCFGGVIKQIPVSLVTTSTSVQSWNKSWSMVGGHQRHLPTSWAAPPGLWIGRSLLGGRFPGDAVHLVCRPPVKEPGQSLGHPSLTLALLGCPELGSSCSRGCVLAVSWPQPCQNLQWSRDTPLPAWPP